jgi:glycosyltransferase involved in cell wall biosynthesis
MTLCRQRQSTQDVPRMSKPYLASIIISSYNYGCFLTDCIDSALNQTYPHTEVIVVDDASTDHSREIIAGYGDRIIPILRRKNEGAKATYNAACELSHGEVVLLLDSDDMLCPTAIEKAVPFFHDPHVVKVHWPLWEIDPYGHKTGRLDPCRTLPDGDSPTEEEVQNWYGYSAAGRTLPDGDFRTEVARHGPWRYASPSTSGNAYSRRFLEKVLPMPRGAYVDTYPSMWALVLGTVRALLEPQGFYRVHDRNNYGSKPFDERLRKDLAFLELSCTELSGYYRKCGIPVDVERWKRNSWYHQVHLSAQEIQSLLPEGDVLILVDEDNWATGGLLAGRHTLPFPECEGEYGGPPADDEAAIRELERLRRLEPSLMVFASQAFWWLDYYPGLHSHLRSQFPCVLENDRLVVFDLRP